MPLSSTTADIYSHNRLMCAAQPGSSKLCCRDMTARIWVISAHMQHGTLIAQARA